MSPENQWLEDVFPTEIVSFPGLWLLVSGRVNFWIPQFSVCFSDGWAYRLPFCSSVEPLGGPFLSPAGRISDDGLPKKGNNFW